MFKISLDTNLQIRNTISWSLGQTHNDGELELHVDMIAPCTDFYSCCPNILLKALSINMGYLLREIWAISTV